MRIAAAGARRRALCAAGAMAAMVTAALAGAVGAASRDEITDWTARVADQPDPEKAKRGTLTIEVLLVDPDRGNERQPAANATVSIEGSEDRHKTNDKGRTPRLDSSAGTVTLQIKVIGVDLCRLRDVPVIAGDQVVSVLVDKAANGKCRRLE